MKRSGRLRVDPAKQRAWQQRSKPLARKSGLPQTRARNVQTPRSAGKSAPEGDTSRNTIPPKVTPRRRNDGPWRAEVILLRGGFCRVCWTTRDLQADHVMPRGQGGPSVVENGTVLCREHHEAKTERRLLYRRAWLDDDQKAWLRDVEWVWWDDDGEVHGRGRRGFEPDAAARCMTVAARMGQTAADNDRDAATCCVLTEGGSAWRTTTTT